MVNWTQRRVPRVAIVANGGQLSDKIGQNMETQCEDDESSYCFR